jgi:hypothetical protein
MNLWRLGVYVGLALFCAPVAQPSVQHDAVRLWIVDNPISGPLHVRLNAPGVIRFATSTFGVRLLDGGHLQTRLGSIEMRRAGDGRLVVRCAPCTIRNPAISRRPFMLRSLEFEARRERDRLVGTLRSGRVALRYEGVLGPTGMQGTFELDETQIRDIYSLFGAEIPELDRALIRGWIAVQGTFRLPEGGIDVMPRLGAFEVRGLGTERMAHGRFLQSAFDAAGAADPRHTGDGSDAWLSLAQTGRWLPRTVVAAEDMRFFAHSGYDLIESVNALRADLASRKMHRGGSTITQQVAKNLFLTQERTLVRKLREILYAVEMEQTLGKRRILALYLNTAEWGPGIYGARDAAWTYFGKDPASLRPEEAAWLACILRNPRAAWRREFMEGQLDTERIQWVLGRTEGLRHRAREAAAKRSIKFAALTPLATVE